MQGWMEITRVPDDLSRADQTAAWQAVVREKLGDISIRYNTGGAPEIDHGHIGVSHTRGWIAVIYNPDTPCAIDIELKTRVLPQGVKKRYNIDTMHDWCARETAYKYSGNNKYSNAKPVRFIDHPELIVALIV